jgi:hypothetical protein
VPSRDVPRVDPWIKGRLSSIKWHEHVSNDLKWSNQVEVLKICAQLTNSYHMCGPLDQVSPHEVDHYIIFHLSWYFLGGKIGGIGLQGPF